MTNLSGLADAELRAKSEALKAARDFTAAIPYDNEILRRGSRGPAPLDPTAAEQLKAELDEIKGKIADAESTGALGTAGSLKTRWLAINRRLAAK